jgi:hypothetical protein
MVNCTYWGTRWHNPEDHNQNKLGYVRIENSYGPLPLLLVLEIWSKAAQLNLIVFNYLRNDRRII